MSISTDINSHNFQKSNNELKITEPRTKTYYPSSWASPTSNMIECEQCEDDPSCLALENIDSSYKQNPIPCPTGICYTQWMDTKESGKTLIEILKRGCHDENNVNAFEQDDCNDRNMGVRICSKFCDTSLCNGLQNDPEILPFQAVAEMFNNPVFYGFLVFMGITVCIGGGVVDIEIKGQVKPWKFHLTSKIVNILPHPLSILCMYLACTNKLMPCCQTEDPYDSEYDDDYEGYEAQETLQLSNRKEGTKRQPPPNVQFSDQREQIISPQEQYERAMSAMSGNLQQQQQQQQQQQLQQQFSQDQLQQIAQMQLAQQQAQVQQQAHLQQQAQVQQQNNEVFQPQPNTNNNNNTQTFIQPVNPHTNEKQQLEDENELEDDLADMANLDSYQNRVTSPLMKARPMSSRTSLQNLARGPKMSYRGGPSSASYAQLNLGQQVQGQQQVQISNQNTMRMGNFSPETNLNSNVNNMNRNEL